MASTPFLSVAEWPSIVGIYTPFCLLIAQRGDIWFISYLLATMNNATDVQVFVYKYVSTSLGYVLSSRMSRSFNNSLFKILRTHHCFPETRPFYIPISDA